VEQRLIAWNFATAVVLPLANRKFPRRYFKQNGRFLQAGITVPKHENGLALRRQQSAAEHACLNFLAERMRIKQKTNEGWHRVVSVSFCEKACWQHIAT